MFPANAVPGRPASKGKAIPLSVEDAARLLQLIVNGAAAGYIYGLIALRVRCLVYKATEMVNFAQGDIADVGRLRRL